MKVWAGISVLFFPLLLFAQPPRVLWSRDYGGPSDEACYAMVMTSDSGYVLAGKIGPVGTGAEDFWIVRVNVDGDTLWTRRYGGTGSDVCRVVQRTSDGGFVFAGYTASFGGPGEDDFWLIKTDANGDSLWSRHYGSQFYIDRCYAALQTADGGFALAGKSHLSWMMLVKTDSLGNEEWTRRFEGNLFFLDTQCRTLAQAADGGFLLGGAFRSPEAEADATFGILCTNANGDSLWTHSYLSPPDYAHNNPRCDAIQPLQQGGYLCLGTADGSMAPGFGIFLIRMDAEFDTLWTRCFLANGLLGAQAAVETADAGLMIAGSSTTGFVLLRLDSLGQERWRRSYNGAECWMLLPRLHDRYLMAGSAVQSGQRDFRLIATRSEYHGVLEASSGTVQFWNILPGDSAVRQLTLHSTGLRPFILTLAVIIPDRTDFHMQVIVPDTIAPGDSRTVEVMFSPQQPGVQQAELLLISSPDEDTLCIALMGHTLVEDTTGDANQPLDGLPRTYRLAQNRPNPFNAQTSISFDLPHTGRATLSVFDLSGREIATLADGLLSAGTHTRTFDASAFASGVYFYRLEAGSFTTTRKLVLLK